jgi:hypothetical protein
MILGMIICLIGIIFFSIINAVTFKMWDMIDEHYENHHLKRDNHDTE